MEIKDRVSILLAEYSSLKAELAATRAAAMQALSIGVPAFSGLLALYLSGSSAGWAANASGIAALLVSFVLAWVAGINDHWARKICERLRDLEQAVNKIAGDTLLRWETEFGSGGIFLPSGYNRKRVPKSN